MNNKAAQQAEKALSSEIARRKLPAALIPILLAQLAVETAGFTSKLSAKYNNLSGIIWAGQKGAFDSMVQKPKGEAKGTYAAYNTVQEWASDYIDTLQRNFPQALNATNFSQFTAALKNGRGGREYMEATQDSYLKALRSWVPQLSALFRDMPFNFTTVVPALVILFITYFLLNKI